MRFRDDRLLNLALAHRSHAAEARFHGTNERLEFLGDAVLGLVASDALYRQLHDRPEGDLARIKSVVVSEASLARIAQRLELNRYLLLGKGEEKSGGRMKRALLADAMEAVLGAHYLDSGLRGVQRFAERLLQPELDAVIAGRHQQDYKTLLQELAQKRFHTYPRYRVAQRRGPEHDQVFLMDVVIDGQTYGPGEGKSKKQAEQGAAEIAYEVLTTDS